MMRSKSLRILLINDTRGIAARRTVLERHGHKVAVAPSVQEGLEQLTSETFDLVVTVYRVPNSSGQPVIEKIRQHDPQILIVVLSGHVEILGLTEQSTGADVVLSKGPHEVQDLLRAIDRLSRRRIPTKPPGSVRAGSRAPKGKTG
jgi:CheY-like chemotaxis protein